MPCSRCEASERRRANIAAARASLQQAETARSSPGPLDVADIQVIDHGVVRPFIPANWPVDRHKLVIFYPEAYTPVCATELGALNQWLPAFRELGCELIAACSDPAELIASWYAGALPDLECLTFSTRQLPERLGLLDGARNKRASVFFMADGDIVKQEHFKKVGRSLAELHRMLYGHSQESYCAEGWSSPADGFLEPPVGDKL